MKYALNILLLFTLFQSSAQNLVPNPSFESYTNCPTNYGEFNQVIDWDNWGGTPDYFNTCAANGMEASAPNTASGYQMPYNGNGMAGLITYSYPSGTQYRENIAVQLTTPLTIGLTYYVSLSVSAGYNTSYLLNCATNNIGVLFTTSAYSSVSPPPLNNAAQINYISVVSDTANWTTITGSFIADSSYLYLSIGNFYDDINTDTLIIDSDSYCWSSYYFIDQVCVSTDSLTCVGNVGLNELSKANKKVVKIVDTMGRETEDKPNTLRIYIYSDGTTEKVYRVK